MATTRELISNIIDIEMSMITCEEDIESLEYEELANELSQAHKELGNKVESLDWFVMELDRRKGAVSGEKDALMKEIRRMRKREKAIENVKKYVNNTLMPMIVKTMGNDGLLETDTARYKLYNSYSPVEVDMQNCDDAFIKTEIVKKADKVKARAEAIKALKEGYEIPGVSIKTVEKVRRS